jgi:UDP-N-acetylmuramoyl-L-alanyl-D-glutamate--2,6-diaminopimelate ligase
VTPYERIIAALVQTDLIETVPDSPPEAITALTEDSRRVVDGSLFCAIAGTAEDGHAYVPDAAARGAAVVMVTRTCDVAIPQIVVRDGRAAVAVAAAEWFGHPAAHLEIVGVTGTNGKSTTVALLQSLLNTAENAGAIGTLGAFDGRNRAFYEEGLTTPGTVRLQETLAWLRDAGVTRVAMEVSSHALDQGRVDGLSFAAGVFTNLTHEHLDYHAGFEDYFRAKARLAGMLREGAALVVNADEPAWESLDPPAGARRVTYGIQSADGATVAAGDIHLGREGAELQLRFEDTTFSARTPLLGEFNVSNALAAAATAWSLGEDPEDIVSRLAAAPQIPGRMERLHGDGMLVLRDYAHTPDALERALAAARPLTPGRLVVLFGAGGDRDRSKRAVMGRVAEAGADVAVVTSDNPRTEDPDDIIDEIVEGMAGAEYVRITDRREAIGDAVGMLGAGDCLILAGKGHETYQVIGTERVPFDERAIVLEAVGKQAPS